MHKGHQMNDKRPSWNPDWTSSVELTEPRENVVYSVGDSESWTGLHKGSMTFHNDHAELNNLPTKLRLIVWVFSF